jgi:inhibitor of cysteine peptidase
MVRGNLPSGFLLPLLFISLAWPYCAARSAISADQAITPEPKQKRPTPMPDQGTPPRPGRSRDWLVLTDTQGGSAGFTGHAWAIAQDGSWQHQRYRNRPIGRPDQQGQLAREQLSRLKRLLAEQDFSSLPTSIRDYSGANPHILSLETRDKKTSLVLPPALRPPPRDPHADPRSPRSRFLVIFHTVRDLLAPQDADGVKIDESHHDQDLLVPRGRVVEVRLRANPTTGYGWQVARNNERVLKPLGEPTYEPQPGPRRLGAGSTCVMRFSAAKNGTARMELHYCRPWEQNTPPADTFRVTVRVR